MLTIQVNESLNHFSTQAGQLMQKYRMFEGLLGLRTIEIKKVDDGGNKIHPIIVKKNNKENKLKVDLEKITEQSVNTYFRDGDEFVFKLTSFDKWIKVIINYKLKGHNLIQFTTH
mmetsp:Transcript_22013/g.19568  ORF Transcript_22013/g.19568 Transcript_22013/m.19568 type:complete len:115 (-) Transcript_22013:1225-1569(-)